MGIQPTIPQTNTTTMVVAVEDSSKKAMLIGGGSQATPVDIEDEPTHPAVVISNSSTGHWAGNLLGIEG